MEAAHARHCHGSCYQGSLHVCVQQCSFIATTFERMVKENFRVIGERHLFCLLGVALDFLRYLIWCGGHLSHPLTSVPHRCQSSQSGKGMGWDGMGWDFARWKSILKALAQWQFALHAHGFSCMVVQLQAAYTMQDDGRVFTMSRLQGYFVLCCGYHGLSHFTLVFGCCDHKKIEQYRTQTHLRITKENTVLIG